jgi:hypothetical protein
MTTFARVTKIDNFDVIQVHIQDLEFKKTEKFRNFEQLRQDVSTYLGKPELFQENYKEYQQVVTHPDNFLGAFVEAYNQHGDVLLSPDDVWIMILLFFSKYVNKQADVLREKFVSHEGKKKLTVVEFTSDAEDSLLMEKNWDVFFEKIIQLITKETKNGVVDKLKCSFSTTDLFHQTISTAAVMDILKKMF